MSFIEVYFISCMGPAIGLLVLFQPMPHCHTVTLSLSLLLMKLNSHIGEFKLMNIPKKLKFNNLPIPGEPHVFDIRSRMDRRPFNLVYQILLCF